MRLGLDLPIQHISHLSGVHQATATPSKCCISGHSECFVLMVVSTGRESLWVSMPHQFVETFGNHVAAIVDCCEVFIERPSNLQARTQTFSNYKHSDTLKYLIGIIAQVVISFISKGWGGHTSDKQEKQNSGFLDKLLPGDIVLADQGFDVKENVGMMCADDDDTSIHKGSPSVGCKGCGGNKIHCTSQNPHGENNRSCTQQIQNTVFKNSIQYVSAM